MVEAELKFYKLLTTAKELKKEYSKPEYKMEKGLFGKQCY